MFTTQTGPACHRCGSLVISSGCVNRCKEETMKSDQRAYPCASCGVMRSASEGGTVFTVCDACWDDTVPSASATTEGTRGETPGRAEKPGGTR